MKKEQVVCIQKDRNVALETQPHYTDSRFRVEQTVFGEKSAEIWDYAYDDRLRQWDYKKSSSAWDAAVEKGNVLRSVKFYEDYLSAYFEKPVTLLHVLAGVNRGNGYPYVVFGYKFEE